MNPRRTRDVFAARSGRIGQEAARARCAVSTRLPAPMTGAHLAHLNPEQRRAVEYGGTDFAAASPLLIIAGAGSGKTNTLAHRVAHLVVNGADPRRIMLLTFSRRAAAEMTRRVERITRRCSARQRGARAHALHLVRHLSCHRRAAAARIRARNRARSGLHDP